MPADLHLHTLHSDGSWSPEELVQAAAQHSLNTISVTDHDTVAGIEAATRCALPFGMEVIPGIEINTVHTTADGARFDVHILGYFIDVAHPALQRAMERQQTARRQLVEDTIERCNKLGIPLTMEDVQACVGRGSIGRPHLSRAIVRAGGAADVSAAFSRFMSRDSCDFIPRLSISPQDAIAAINESGGIASIAHPGKNERMERIILELKEAGLAAVEAYHRSHSLELVRHYLKLAAHNGLLVTGGSDCHGPAEGYAASIGSVKVPMDVVQNLKAKLSTRVNGSVA